MALVLAVPASARVPVPTPRPQTDAPQAPASPQTGADGKLHQHSLTDIPDMSKAVPASQIGTLPSTEDRYRTLKTVVQKVQPKVEAAKSTSDTLKAEAEALRARLIVTAAKVEGLEAEKTRLDGEIAGLAARETEMAASFAHDRVAVAHLLALLERLQHDQPPVLVLSADDALSAAHRAMLLGASLPRVYGQAAALARRLDALRKTRSELVERRRESATNAVALKAARGELDQLLAKKQAEADTAAERYATLETKFEAIAQQATDLGQFLDKVATLRAETGATGGLPLAPGFAPRIGALARPVAGRLEAGGIEGVGGARAPGITFTALAGGRVIAPADGKVLFAGAYHRTGQVLILELGGGYDLVLAGLGAVDVRTGDGVLAGEPLGTMPEARGQRSTEQLYMELRHGGKAMSPLPWLETSLRKAERS